MKKLAGFTLVELFMVIAIILLLIAILVPAVQGAWEAVLAMQCQSNMHQICTAMLDYAAVHNGRLPGGEGDPAYLEWLGNPLAGDLWGNLWRCPQSGALFEHVGSEDVYLCPKDRFCSVQETRDRGGPPRLAPGSELGNGRFSYSMAQILSGASLSLLRDAHSEYLDLDGKWQSMGVLLLVEEDPEYHIGYVYPQGSWCNTDEFSDRHFGGCNLGFLDGHVEWRQVPPGMNAWDLTLVKPAGSIPYGTMGLTWEYGLDDWYGDL